MGRPKAEIVVGGARLVDRAVAVLRAAGCAPVLAVVRAGVDVADATAVINPDPSRGLRSSLELAVSAAGDAEALAVVLVDAPGVGPDAVTATVRAWRPGRIAVARFRARRGHPIVMAPALWRAALALAGPDEGARELLAHRPELVDEVDVPGDPTDLDSPDDLVRWTGERS
jgi:molybdenum cofactor cytidylyltransferase/nicotine blue oxidoreductase